MASNSFRITSALSQSGLMAFPSLSPRVTQRRTTD